MIHRSSFRAMGTNVELFVECRRADRARGALGAARLLFARLESQLSRFRPDSELSRLNAEGRLRAAPDLVRVTELAIEARERTGGRFDPTVHDAIVAAGYDRTFEELRGGTATLAPAACRGRVRVDRATGTIELDPGVRLDLGGIAKGYAADRACDLLRAAGPCLVNAGGDAAVRGGTWPVGVETPGGTITLELTRGAIATSGADRRRWQTPTGEAHHLIDPATGAPSTSDLLRVTAVGRTAVEAEVRAKALFLSGVESARAEADRRRQPAVLVTRDGRTVLAGGLA